MPNKTHTHNTDRRRLLRPARGSEARDFPFLGDHQLDQALAVLERETLQGREAAVHARDGAVGAALWT